MAASSPPFDTHAGARPAPRGTIASRLMDYHLKTRAPLGAALTVLPLALIYGLGLLAAAPEARSGVDQISGLLLDRLGVDGYVGVHIGLAVMIVGYACWYHRRAVLSHLMLTGPVLLEATFYGARWNVRGPCTVHGGFAAWCTVLFAYLRLLPGFFAVSP